MQTHRTSIVILIVIAAVGSAAPLLAQQADWRTAVGEPTTDVNAAAPPWALRPTAQTPWPTAATNDELDESDRVLLAAGYEEISPAPEESPLSRATLPVLRDPFANPCGGSCQQCTYCGNGMPFCEYCDASCFPVHNSRWVPDWITLNAVFWWPQGPETPPLVTTDGVLEPEDQPGNPGSNGTAGVLPDAQVRYGGEMEGTLGTGGLLSFGYWLDQSREWGLGTRFYVMHSGGNVFDFVIRPSILSINQRRIENDKRVTLALPFFEVGTGEETALLLGRGPVDGGIISVQPGAVNVRSPIDFVGGDLQLRRALVQTCRGQRLYFVGGYEYARLDEQLTVTAFSTVPNTPFQTNIFDEFTARNEFQGAHLGLLYEHDVGRWNFNVQGKIALGNMRQQLRTRGILTIEDLSDDSIVSQAAGGLFVQPTNTGTFEQDEFGAIPQLQVQFQKRIACVYGRRLQLDLGYDLFFFNSVMRPGAQIDRRINFSQFAGGDLVGPPLPTFEPHTSSMWIQGFRLGVTWTH